MPTPDKTLTLLDRNGGRLPIRKLRRHVSPIEQLRQRGAVEIRRGRNGGVQLTDIGAVELFRHEGAEPYRRATAGEREGK